MIGSSLKVTIWLYCFSILSFFTSFVPPILTALVRRTSPSFLSIGEMVDLLTPFLVLSTCIMLLISISRNQRLEHLRLLSTIALIISFLGAVMAVSGHGIHLVANSLNHFLNQAEHHDIYLLSYFFDEILSHYMWHTGAIILVFGIALFEISHPFKKGGLDGYRTLLPAFLFAGTFTFASLEGETVPLILPLSILFLLLLGLLTKNSDRSNNDLPVTSFFAYSCVIMLIFFTIYGFYWWGFPSPLHVLGNNLN